MKKNKITDNKKIVRKKNKAGSFTTINYSLLRDKNLTSNSKILMMEVLSDSDLFTFSETLYMKRMGIEKTAFYNSLDNLEENGYLRRKKIGSTHYNHYTFSEYGNLKDKELDEDSLENSNSSEKSNAKEEVSINENSCLKISEKQQEKLKEFLILNKSFVTDDIAIEFIAMKNENIDYYQFKSKLDKLIEKEKKKNFKECKEIIEKSTAYGKKSKNDGIKLLKVEIFEKNILVINAMKLVHKAVENINRNKPMDQESLDADRLGGQPEND